MKPELITRWRTLFVIAGTLLFMPLPGGAQIPHKESAESVVKITCQLPGGQLNSTGFVWSKPAWVVTALHGVAGCSSIVVYSEKLKDEVDAKLIAAHRKSDLALLELKRELALPPLSQAPVAPSLEGSFYVWGYPRAIPSLKGDSITFSHGLRNSSTLGATFFKTPGDFEKQVGDQGYPGYDAEILRIGSTIQPGHSGAPILDAEGRVVAIADGGLYQGTAGINWSIPASIYLPMLAGSRDAVPGQPSKTAQLFSSSTPQEPDTIEFKFKGGGGGTGQLEKVWRIPVTGLADLMFEEDLDDYKQSLSKIRALAARASVAVENLYIDIYEDYQTGSTIAVPANLELLWDEESGYLQVKNENASASMIVAILRTDSWEAAQKELPFFAEYVDSIGDWEEDKDYGTEQEVDEAEHSLSFETALSEKGENGVDSAYATIYIRIDDSDLLATAVLQLDYYDALSVHDKIDLELLWLSERLTNFAQQ